MAIWNERLGDAIETLNSIQERTVALRIPDSDPARGLQAAWNVFLESQGLIIQQWLPRLGTIAQREDLDLQQKKEAMQKVIAEIQGQERTTLVGLNEAIQTLRDNPKGQ